MIYIYVTLFSILICLLISKLPILENTKSKVQIISFIPLTVIGAVRAYVGIDYTTYSYYQIPEILRGVPNVKFEFLAKQIVFLGYKLSGETHYFWIFSIIHIVLMFFTYIYIIKQSPNISLSILLLVLSTFFAFGLSGMRQAIGTSIVFCGFFYLSKKRIIPYIFFVVIASLFHSSAIIYFFLIPLAYIYIPWGIQFLILVFSVFFAQFGTKFISSIMLKYNFFSEYVGGIFYTGAYSKYFLYFVIAIFCINFFFLNLKKTQEFVIDKLYINLNLLMTITGIMMPAIPTPERDVYMFLPIQLILVPKIVHNIRDRREKVVAIVIYLSIFVLFYIFVILKDNRYATLPYRTIFKFLE